MNKMEYKFKKQPQNLKYQLVLTKSNTDAGWNDIFEVFVCYRDNKEYLVSPKVNNYNLVNNKNSYNYNEYLISGDDNKIVIIWDINNNYNIKHHIDTKYGYSIYRCLLIFPHNIDNNYIVTSTFNNSGDNESSATKIFSLDNCHFIKFINNSNKFVVLFIIMV